MLPPPFHTPPVPTSTRKLVPVLYDDATIVALISKVLDRSPFSIKQLADQLGITRSAIYQYRAGRRPHPSVQWLVRLVEATGGRVWIELPDDSE